MSNNNEQSDVYCRIYIEVFQSKAAYGFTTMKQVRKEAERIYENIKSS